MVTAGIALVVYGKRPLFLAEMGDVLSALGLHWSSAGNIGQYWAGCSGMRARFQGTREYWFN